MLVFSFWQASSSRFKRVVTVTVCFLLSVGVTIAGVLTPMSPEESAIRSEELDRVREAIESMDMWQSTLTVFQNNFMICLIMFVPIAGPVFGFYVLYNTGLMIAAESNLALVPPLLVFLMLFLFPFTWMEFVAYSTALASSFWLIWRIIRREARKEVVRTGLFILICLILLLVGAAIESIMIASVIHS